MPQHDVARLKLRRAFRYAYCAFVAVVAALLLLLGLWIFNGDLLIVVVRSIADSSVLIVTALCLGLCVPAFFALWSLVGSAILGLGANQSSLMDGVRD